MSDAVNLGNFTLEELVDAIDRLPWVTQVKQMLAERQGPGAGQSNSGANPGAGEPPAPQPAGAGGAGPAPLAPAAPKPEPPKAPEAPKPEEPKKNAAGAGDGTGDDEGKEREEYSRLHKHYMADEQYTRYSALRKKYGGDADTEYREAPEGAKRESETILPGGAKPEGAKKDYAAGAAGTNDGKAPERPAESSVDGNLTPASGTAGADTGDAATPYARQGDPERYARQQEEITSLRQQVEEHKAKSTNTERYSRLQQLRMRFAFDLEKAAKLLQYGKATDEQFAAHCDLIESSGREIPIGEQSRALEAALEVSETPGANAGGGRAIAAKYSREHQDTALKICTDRRLAGREVDYQLVLADVAAGRTPTFTD